VKIFISPSRFFLLSLGILVFSTFAFAQVEPDDKKEPPSEGMQDTLNRMKIKRAEIELKKLIKSSEQALEISQTLSELIDKESLGKPAEKKLHEIDKAAKQIRNYIGSANKEEEFTPPKNLSEAVSMLTDSCKKMNEQMEKTSRHVVSAALVISSSDVLRLTKILRTYIR
jgi:vacuolar-type H+-ATPase subunit I/STV1